MTASVQATIKAALPAWVPNSVRLYLSHTEGGLSLRALARVEGCHASTVMRLVRRFENRRDDPLVDEALTRLGQGPANRPAAAGAGRAEVTFFPDHKDPQMTVYFRADPTLSDEAMIAREARRILRRLCETGSILVVAPDMEKAVVLRTAADGRSTRTAVVERVVAQAFALKEWITCRQSGRVAAYEITNIGRLALKRLLADDQTMKAGFAEAATPFGEQHRLWGERAAPDAGESEPRRMRYNMAESPVALLARRQDKDGALFLSSDLVHAAERLREDFELAQMGPRVAQNWDRFLTAGDKVGFSPDKGIAEGSRSARDRVAAALRELGPGLGDVALRVCCFLEGIEAAERRMGWAARSGKIVLRIALQRLRRHYDDTYGRSGPLIG